MDKHFSILILSTLFALSLMRCNSDRTPAAPVEIDRPVFSTFTDPREAAIAVPLRSPIQIKFNEPMDPQSFQGNFSLTSVEGSIDGSFSASGNQVIFTPAEDMLKAMIYTATFTGRVKDAHENSLELESDYRQNTWFLSEGDYSDGGFNRVYVTDNTNNRVFVLGNFNELIATIEDVESPVGVAATPDGSKVFVVNNIAAGKISVIDPANNTKMKDIDVGVGPTEMAATNAVAYVVNRSARTISVIDLSSETVSATISFSDGFRPRHIAITPDEQRLYLTSNDRNKKGVMKVINTADNSEAATLTGVLQSQRSAQIAVSADGAFVYVLEDRTGSISVIRTADNSLDAPITIPGTNSNLAAAGNFLYVSSSEGAVFKIDTADNSIADTAQVSTRCEGVQITPGAEILYVVTPDDSTVSVLETHTMQKLRTTVVSNTGKNVTISALKF